MTMTTVTMTRLDHSVIDAPLDASTSLPRKPESVRAARRWLAAHLAAWEADDNTTQNALLLLSEVVTNAVLHNAGTDDSTITASWWQGYLRVTVSDPDLYITASDSADDEHGRGLMIVTNLATRWGEIKTLTGKKVWFELDERGDRR
jgi:anti-sigma regulatory factor (Ser/Thr protein kinase)